MIQFHLNGTVEDFTGNPDRSLLSYLREDKHLTAAKDGCSGQATCGACLVEIDGKPRLACSTKMEKIQGARIFTLEGIPDEVRRIIATTFVNHGAVQCGFCSPGFVMRTHLLLRENPNPTEEQIKQAIKGHLCRCTGYKKIESAIADSALQLSGKKNKVSLCDTGPIGISSPKYQAFETAIGKRNFVNDMHFEGMLFGALHFSAHPRARVLSIDTSEAKGMPGVKGVFTAKDIPEIGRASCRERV